MPSNRLHREALKSARKGTIHATDPILVLRGHFNIFLIIRNKATKCSKEKLSFLTIIIILHSFRALFGL